MIGPKTAASWYMGQVNGHALATPEGGLHLPLVNRWPDWRGVDLSPEGEEAGWENVLPDEAVLYHVQESRPGKRSGTGVPQEEKDPPRADTMTRQTEAPVPLDEAWTANQPRIDGFSPYQKGDPHAEEGEPLPAPEVEAVAVASGYAGGRTPVAYTLSSAFGETTASGTAFVELGTGQGYRFPLPEGLLAGARGPLTARKINVYQGTPGGGASTLRKQESFVLDDLQDDYVEMTGPYRDKGEKPPARNRSGIGRPPQPGGNNPNRARWDIRKTNGDFELQEGDYRVGYQVRKGGGFSLVSQWSREFTVNQKEKGRAIVLVAPRNLSEDERVVWWITKDDVPYRVYAKRGGAGESDAHHRREKVEVYGYTEDTEPRGLKDGLTQVQPPDPNDPSADTTAIEPPDPNTPPDEPVPIDVSVERGQPATVKVAVSGVTETGGELARSAPVSVRLEALQTYRVRPQPPVGVLANGRFSAVDKNGKPDLWTLRNITSANYTASAGGLTMRQPVTIGGNFPTAEPEKTTPITPDSTARFVGSVAVLRRLTGAAQLVVYQHDEAGAVIPNSAIVLKSITSGKTSLGARGMRVGAGTPTPWHADAVAYSYVARMVPGADPSVNMDMRVEGLEAFPFDAAPRAFSRLEDGSATFEPPASVPHPDRSHHATGEAPIPTGAETETPDPALTLVTFDSGSWNPTTPVSGSWGALDSAGGATGTVSSASAIFGANGIEVKSDSTTNQSYYRYRYDGGAGLSSLALRKLVGCTRLTKGEANLHRVEDGSGNLLALVRRVASGSYVLDYHGPGGSRIARRTILADELIDYDVEIIVSGGGTKDGRVAVFASRFGEARELAAELTGLDFRDRRPRYARALVTGETNTQSRWTFRFDQIVVTSGGDMALREAPALPAGETPEDPDAPLSPAGAGTFRLDHSDGERVRQSAFFLRPGTAPGTYGPRTTEPIPVKPGQQFTLAVFLYAAKFGDLRGVPSHPFAVVLRGPGKEPLVLGSVCQEGCVGEVAWQEFSRVFAVPAKTSADDPGYTEAWVESRDMSEMYMLWQEGLFADGALTTLAERDAARTTARRTSGSARVTMDSRVRHGVHTPTKYRERRWGSFGVVGTGVANELYRSGPTASGPWSTATSDRTAVPEDAFLDVSFDLASDGTEDGEAEVPPGGVYLSIDQDMALLQNEDGEDLPGLAVIGELLPDFTRPELSVKKINGKPFASEISDDVRQLPPFAVQVYTEEAARFMLELTPNDRVRIPDPHANDGEGLNFLARVGDVLELEDKGAPTEILADPDSGERVRRVFASFAVPWAHVLEAAPLARGR